MDAINIKKELSGTVEETVGRLTKLLQEEGFGVLTRIDLHEKFKEKLGKKVPPAVVLGACNPALAYEAYITNPDAASLLPCNAVVRQSAPGKVSVELARPSALIELLGDARLKELGRQADLRLAHVLERLTPVLLR